MKSCSDFLLGLKLESAIADTKKVVKGMLESVEDVFLQAYGGRGGVKSVATSSMSQDRMCSKEEEMECRKLQQCHITEY